MDRNTHFVDRHEPFSGTDVLQMKTPHTTGPFAFLNPTFAILRRTSPAERGAKETENAEAKKAKDAKDAKDAKGNDMNEELAENVDYQWRSRDNRKGRHALIVEPARDAAHAKYVTPPPSNSPREVAKGVVRMVTQFPVWDVSYLVATIFTLGSVVWVFNAFFVWLPLVDPSTTFTGETTNGGGITAFIGATIFEIGSWLLMIEACNEQRSGCFGWALSKVVGDIEGKSGLLRLSPDPDGCVHHHTNKKNFVGKASTPADAEGEVQPGADQSFIWFPAWEELTTHYLREIGFLACLSQLAGATIFWIAGFTALPGVIDMGDLGLADGVYWAPQVIGGTGFIISGTLFMLETQQNWYLPAYDVLGWHIGAWNLIGGIGFTLSGALGFSTSSGCEYQAALSTFWGSWAFLIGSTLQWYESLSKHPVEERKLSSEEKKERRESLIEDGEKKNGVGVDDGPL